jgi:hypothetical protein
VTLGEGIEDTRRRVLRSELDAIPEIQQLTMTINDPHFPAPGVIDA